jgi:NAD(P)-dependent dehydrogenase (short-subunit alcohol dehydrogenase family)
MLSGPHYVVSKGGVHSFIKWVAKDGAGHSVYVNGIAPGPIATDMTKGYPYSGEMVRLKRLGTVEDIAEAAVFLASQASNWITGMVMDVNGGMQMY